MRPLTFEQFFARANRVGACDLWSGATNSNGYGVVRWRNRTWLAHRLAWVLAIGEIPYGMQVLHHCDTPSCIQVAHLFLGTHTDNMRDAAAKGRNVMQRRPDTLAGERNPSARLTVGQVRRIRLLAAEGMNRGSISVMFGVTRSHVDDIVAMRRWKHAA